MFNKNSIGSQVHRVIKQRIANAEKVHQEKCEAIDAKAEADHADKLVTAIVGPEAKI